MSDAIYFNKEHEMIRKAIREFVDKEINPHVAEWEEQKITPLHELFKKMGDLGFLGIRYDPKYGGQGLDYWHDLVFVEEMGRITAGGVSMGITVQTHMATPAIDQFGSDFLKETYLTKAISGDMVCSIAVTEPGAGSDVGALATTARKEGHHYILNGSKTYITNGTQADFLTLLARTSDDPGYHSFSLFVVPTDLPGFSVSRKLDKIGMHSSDTAELFFDDMKIPAENLIGQEGEGFIYQMQQFQHERFVTLPLAYVSTRQTIQMTIEHIRQRTVFGKPLVQRQVLRHRLADWLTEIEGLKRLTYHIVNMKMAGLDVTKEVSMGKLMAGRMAHKVADGCLQMFGGLGYMAEMPISRAFLDSRLTSIGGGADEVMAEIIARMEGF